MTTIKQILYDRRMSQSALARETRIPQSSMNLICNNRLVPCPARRSRIADALGVSQAFLFPSETLEVK